MKLSLIIPYYNTPAELVDRLFKSVNEQKNFDFNELQILFVDDCSTEKYNYDRFTQFENLAEEKINIINLKENGGSGVARQYGIHYAKGDYLLFADSDDKFRMAHKETVKELVEVEEKGQKKVIEKDVEKEFGVFEFFLRLIDAHPNANIIRTSWLEEQNNTELKKIFCIPHLAQLDNTWMHGKLFKRSFIEDNKIQFHRHLRKQEDTYFNSIASEIAKDAAVAYNGLLSYVWCDDNKDSLTRNNNCLYSYNAMNEFVDAIDYAVEYLNSLQRDDVNIVDKVVGNILYVYWMLQTPSWRDKSKIKYFNALRKRVGKFEQKYRDVWNYLPIDDKHFAEMYISRYSMQYETEKFIPQETFKQFLKSIRKLT